MGDNERRVRFLWGRDFLLSVIIVPSLMTYFGWSPLTIAFGGLAALAILKTWEQWPVLAAGWRTHDFATAIKGAIFQWSVAALAVLVIAGAVTAPFIFSAVQSHFKPSTQLPTKPPRTREHPAQSTPRPITKALPAKIPHHRVIRHAHQQQAVVPSLSVTNSPNSIIAPSGNSINTIINQGQPEVLSVNEGDSFSVPAVQYCIVNVIPGKATKETDIFLPANPIKDAIVEVRFVWSPHMITGGQPVVIYTSEPANDSNFRGVLTTPTESMRLVFDGQQWR